MSNSSTRMFNMRAQLRLRQSGMSLIMVLLILVVVSLLGVGGAQIALMSERGARNDRDQQMAWQAAEAGLIDAENDIWNPVVASTRRTVFDGKSTYAFPDTGCSTSGTSQGLCAAVLTGKPAWLTEDFTSTGSGAPTTEYGTFTGASFESGGPGIQPAQKPRYLIEPVVAQTGDATNPAQEILYRVTVMGFGPRTDIQAVIQMLYRL
ncbi:PilX N-terminal domain-containing pilus assembly protein [Rhodoferax sp.]|uniref:pilus assembly PilX family protein n=1 Tax=Rhodoferax sp. TaxID=50421 RepID=UPI00284EE00E|nr:PilX N-terminal domain-containing pilus assembly protein [Rhodoferax sp.]MDR3369602.1 PilX N-terminal domain-containing pilus assembly protein [Rhodoferax sp.]